MARPFRVGSSVRPMKSHRVIRGYTYIGLLFFLLLAGLGLSVAAHWWHMETQRDREKELLFIGDQFRRAIASYYASTSGRTQYPKELDELIEDRRHPMPVRHLRRIYRDPMTGESDWVLIKEHERIIGVSSRSKNKPVKIAGFPDRYKEFNGAPTYAEWRFVHRVDQEGEGENQTGTLKRLPGTNPGTKQIGNPGTLPGTDSIAPPIDELEDDPGSPDS